MKQTIRLFFTALLFSLALIGSAQARSDIKDGNAMVKPEKGVKFSIDGATLGKAELYGYIADLRDTDKITGVVLKKGGDDEQRRIIGSIAKALGLKSFEQDGRELKDIPQPQDTPKPPPIESAEPAAAGSDTH
ncbi:hypothetical protein [Dokdonella sp.]|uniref:hypothetical protein n=1 Tax=Dokdonella sp. TaxID=2291710 RepID=UPI0025BBB737|nr:hypothetical protein [Dokdonella sp.]MBX3688148.1 hypothetical protein [Dokdonella sp.]